jgi:hypothetical protein
VSNPSLAAYLQDDDTEFMVCQAPAAQARRRAHALSCLAVAVARPGVGPRQLVLPRRAAQRLLRQVAAAASHGAVGGGSGGGGGPSPATDPQAALAAALHHLATVAL